MLARELAVNVLVELPQHEAGGVDRDIGPIIIQRVPHRPFRRRIVKVRR
jgi:hypothetical protein